MQVDNTGKVVLSKTVFFVVVCTQKPLYFCEQQQLPKGTGRFCFSPSNTTGKNKIYDRDCGSNAEPSGKTSVRSLA